MIRRIFAALLGSSLFLWTATAANAAQPSGPQGDSWDSLKRLPNWTGVWQSLAGREGNLPLQKGAGNVRSSVYNLAEAPLTPAWHKKIDDLAALRKRGGDVEGRAKYCIFLGFPGGMAGPRSIHEFL